jgi:hypothetical protein
MNFAKALRFVLLITILFIGVWMLTTVPTGPGPEVASRQQAIRALAPVPPEKDRGDIPPSSGLELVSPIEVNIKDIPVGESDPNSQFERWMRGEIDLEMNEGFLSDAEVAALQEAALKLPPSSNIQTVNSVRTPDALAPGTAFDSLDYNESSGGYVPPDPEMAAGPNHLIAVVNVTLEIYNKSGTTLVGPLSFSSVFASDSNCTGLFDPNVIYDEAEDRFILGIDADGTHYCVAVSQTGDPTGFWNIYSFSTVASSSDFFDYPHAGVGRDAIYMGANIYGTFSFHSQVYAFDKGAMYAGNPAASATHNLSFNYDTPQPLHLHGFQHGTWPTTGPHYFLTDKNFNGKTYTIHSWSDPFGADTFSVVGTVDLEASTGVSAGLPIDVPQSGGDNFKGNDYRPQDFEYRDGYGWTVQTISCNPGGGTVDCIRWAKINPATATVVDSGVYASSGVYRVFGDLAVNACGDMAVGYTKSSTSMYPAVFYTGRENSDPAGTLQAETQLKVGETTYVAFDGSPYRWGDYTAMTIAPDGTTFWYLGEYSKNTGTTYGRWGTYIGSFSYPNCVVTTLDPRVFIPLVLK